MKTFGWLSSIRAIAVILTFGLLYLGVFQNKITGDNIMAIATGVVIGYFGKRDSNEERNILPK
jgi:hypothetical protein